MVNIFLSLSLFFLAATCTGEQQSKFFVLLRLLFLSSPPLPSCVCLGKRVSVHAGVTCRLWQCANDTGCAKSGEDTPSDYLMAVLLRPFGREILFLQSWLLGSSGKSRLMIRGEVDTESKDDGDLITGSLGQKGYSKLMKLSTAEGSDRESKLSC